MTDEEYNVYDDLRVMWRTVDRDLNRCNQAEILERLEGYYDEV